MKNVNELNILRILLFATLILSINLLYLDLRELNLIGDGNNILGKSTTSAQSCPQACITQIQKEVATVKSTGVISNAVKESFVPIGSGVSDASDWEDVPGLQVIVDTAQYSRIKEVYFEASVHVKNKNQIVYVRLYNATDKHPVWFSELVFPNANVPASQTSPKITLDPGNKAYKIQMKTQLQYEANLDQSRIRIVTQ